MRAVVQRVTEARVWVDAEVVEEIRRGIVVLVGVTHGDTPASARAMASKLWTLRIFDDATGVMNHSVGDANGTVLVISQFTVYGDVRRGRRPSWTAAAPAPEASRLVQELVGDLVRLGASVAEGRFGARMQVELVNDGPVTLVIDVA